MTVSLPNYHIPDIDCHNCSNCELIHGNFYCKKKDNMKSNYVVYAIDNVARYELPKDCGCFYNISLKSKTFLNWLLS
jgi:hypothetical protein